MKDLSPRLRELIERSRDADNPTAADKVRVRLAVAETVAAAPQGVLRLLRPGHGIIHGLALLVLSGGAGYGVWRLLARPDTPSDRMEITRDAEPWSEMARPGPPPVATPPVATPPVATPPVATPPVATRPPDSSAIVRSESPPAHPPGRRGDRVRVRTPAPAAAAAEPPPATTPSTATPPPAEAPPVATPAVAPVVDSSPPAAAQAPPSPPDIAEELRLLRQAQAFLARDTPDRALAVLTEHATRFGQGALREERLAAQVLALCALDRVVEARAVAAQLRGEAPHSPQLPRLRSSCVEPDDGGQR